MNQASTLKYSFMLLLVTVFWGSGFIMVKVALNDGFSPALVTTARMAFAVIIMFPIFFKAIKKSQKGELIHGLVAGFILFAGFLLQTFGMQFTIISNSAFLTTTNVIMVPFLSWLILRKRPKSRIFFSIALGFIGVSILTHAFDANIRFNLGDILSLLSAVCFALQIAYTEYAVKKVNCDSFTFLEIAFTGVFSAAYLFVFDSQSFGQIISLSGGLLATLYLGATCTFYAFWAQSVAQKHMASSKAALILSMEAVFASIFSVLLGFEQFEYTLAVGGSIIMASIIILEMGNRIAAKNKLKIEESCNPLR